MKNISLDLKSIKKLAKKLLLKLYRYSTIIFIVITVGLFGFLIYQINNASNVTPSEANVTEQRNAVKRLKIDEQSIKKIQQLEDQNVGVQTLFQDARENPFQE